MDSIAGRLFGRWRLVYVLIASVVGMVIVQTVVGATIVVFARFEGMSGSQQRSLILHTLGAGTACGLGGYVFSFVRHRAVVRWLRRPEPITGRVALWEEVVRFPLTLAVSTSAAAVPPGYAVFVAKVRDLGYDRGPDTALLLGGGAFIVLFFFTTTLLYSRFVLAPAVRELGTELDLAHVPEVHGRLALRIAPALLILTWQIGIGVAALTIERGAGPRRLLEVFAVSGVLSVSAALFVTALITAGIIGPLRVLIEATGRVRAGDYATPVPIITDDEHGELALSFNDMLRGLRQRESLRGAVRAYIDPVIAEQVELSGSVIPGQTVDVTVMFVDIVGFTAYAEHLAPDRVVADLNEFFDLVIPAIEAEGGHANKLLGDGVMAVFGVPRPFHDHADRALRAARAVHSALQRRYGSALRAGIGLHSGPVVVGSMGGGGKLDYTIVGDAVNVASRVEAHTRVTGDAILLTNATKSLLRDAAVDGFVDRGRHVLRGRANDVALYAAA